MRRKTFVILLVLLCAGFATDAKAQLQVRTDYMTGTDLTDGEGTKYGHGDMLKQSARLTVPLSVRKDNAGRVKA